MLTTVLLGFAMAFCVPVTVLADEVNKVVDQSYTDAEKYLEEGYDSDLCWAATAANMLWTSDYAPNAIDPRTNELFGNEDEVFDYFRNCFTDLAGVPDGAITYFIDGQYEYTDVEDVSQLKDDAPDGALMPGALEPGSLGVVSFFEGEVLDALEGLYNRSAGALLHWWDTDTNGFHPGAHWLTIAGLVTGESGYEGIWFADSDNDPASDIYHGNTDEEKAELAAGMDNSYTYYPLSPVEIDDYLLWMVNGFIDGERYQTLITHVFYLMNMSTGGDVVPQTNDTSDITGNDGDDTSVTDIQPSNYSEDEITGFVFAELKAMMVENGLIVYSPTGNVYDKTSSTGYSLIIRRMSTSLLNVYVDGKRLGINGQYYTITVNPEGLFTITLSKEFVQTLDEGEHSLRMEFDGGDDINYVIVVK